MLYLLYYFEHYRNATDITSISWCREDINWLISLQIVLENVENIMQLCAFEDASDYVRQEI